MQSAVLAMIDVVCLSICHSVCLSARPSVCHTMVSCQNNSIYDHAVFTVG